MFQQVFVIVSFVSCLNKELWYNFFTLNVELFDLRNSAISSFFGIHDMTWYYIPTAPEKHFKIFLTVE